ncbi:MAG: hypothetical protein K940chlam3_01538 [Chlamydiae bacterium]|nr:hypothetical protein [Chlamydiota bacterium]
MPELERLDGSAAVDGTPIVGDHSLQKMIHMMLVEKLDQVDEKARVEVDILLDRQKRVEFLNKYEREVNSVIDNKTGTVEREKLNDLIEEGLELKADADIRRENAAKLRDEIEELKADDEEGNKAEIAKKTKEAEWLEQSAEEAYTVLQACDIIDKEGNVVDGLTTYIETATTRLMENIRSYKKMLQTRNNTQSQMVQRLNNERNEALMLAKDIQKTIHEIMKRMASNIR